MSHGSQVSTPINESPPYLNTIDLVVIWTAQGKYLTLNSNEDTMALNSGIFWAIFQSRSAIFCFFFNPFRPYTYFSWNVSYKSSLMFRVATLYFCSLLFGNLFVHFEFADAGSSIDKNTRLIVYAVLTGTGVLGTLLMITLRSPSSDRDSNIQRLVLL